jgi:hypothetical protein
VSDKWGSPVETEVRRRITAAVAAYAYEVRDEPIMSDTAFDKLVQSINPKMGTCHPILDEFFASRFSPMTGIWIHDHPELPGIIAILDRWYTGAIRDNIRKARAKGKLP